MPSSIDKQNGTALDPDPGNSGALERHPRFEEVRQAYNEWRDALPASEKGSPGQRNWRTKCVDKACGLLWAKTGRVTAAAVMQIIKFGSTTSVNSDVQTWLRGQAPRREALLDLSGLIESEAVQDAFQTALQSLLAVTQAEARKQAQEAFDARRAELAASMARMQQELQGAVQERETAVRTSAAIDARRVAAERERETAQAQVVELDRILGAKTIELDQAAARELDLRQQIDKVRQETDAAIARLEAVSTSYARDVQRLEGAYTHALTEIEAARAETRTAREEARKVGQQNAALKARIDELTGELLGAARTVGDAQAEARMLRERLEQETRRADALQAEIGRQGESARAGEKLRAALLAGAMQRKVIVRALQDNAATLQVSGDTLPQVWLAKSGLAITPEWDSLSQLESFCAHHAREIAELAGQVPTQPFWATEARLLTSEKKTVAPAAKRRGQPPAERA